MFYIQHCYFRILLQARCDVNAQDFDGWTPLHAAAHWGQLEACELLVENFCNMDIKNYAVRLKLFYIINNQNCFFHNFTLIGSNCI